MLVVESTDAGEVTGSFFIIIWSFGLRWRRILVVEPTDAGEVKGRFL